MFGNTPVKVDYSSCTRGPNPVYAIISLDPLSWDNWRSHSCIKVKVGDFWVSCYYHQHIAWIHFYEYCRHCRGRGSITKKNNQTVFIPRTSLRLLFWPALLYLLIYTWFLLEYMLKLLPEVKMNRGSWWRSWSTGEGAQRWEKESFTLLYSLQLGWEGGCFQRDFQRNISLQLSDFSSQEWRPVLWHRGVGGGHVIKEQNKSGYSFKSLWMDGAWYRGVKHIWTAGSW